MINTISNLVDRLQHNNPKDYPKLIKQIDIPPSAFDKYANWEDTTYTRNCIFRDSEFELILLCWKNIQSTPIHAHGGEQCWVYQIKGKALEKRYSYINDKLILESTYNLEPGVLSYMDDEMGYHAIQTLEERVMTLHIYVNPIDKCLVYNADIQSFEIKHMTYDSIHGSPVITNIV